MKHPEIFLLPVLMFSDYYLTVLGAVLKDKKYADHFKSEHYELNPLWQKQISQKKWLNVRHIVLTCITTSVLACLIELGYAPEYLVKGILGCLFILYGTIVGRHLSNILIFRLINRSPDDLSGQIVMSHSLTLSMSTYQYLVVAVPLLILAVFSPTPFVLGGLVGILLLFLIHIKWLMQHKKRQASSSKDQTS